MIYAPDTNFFIQCKDAIEIEWSLVCDAEEVVLVVLNEVHREIDRLKNGGNARRARRAKVISSQLRNLIVASQEQIELKTSAPKVFLKLAPRLNPDRIKPANYDASSADERIAEEAKACGEEAFDGNITLLSHDGMPLRAAQLLGVSICPIPDAWLLPPEIGEHERAINKLNERVAALEKQAPVIGFRLEGETALEISGDLMFYRPLTSDFIESTMDAIRAAYPVQTPSIGKVLSPLENAMRGWAPAPTEADVLDYETKYKQWSEEVENYICRLPQIYNLASDSVDGYLVLTNTGTTPAEHLVVDVSTVGPIRLQEPRDEDEEIEIPAIPAPPTPRRTDSFGGLTDYGSGPFFREPIPKFRMNTSQFARNRHEFYWEFDEPEQLSEHCRGECADFRHGLKDERIRLLLRWDEPKEGAISGAIRVVVSAGNLPISVAETIPIRLNTALGDSESLIKSIIYDDLGISL